MSSDQTTTPPPPTKEDQNPFPATEKDESSIVKQLREEGCFDPYDERAFYGNKPQQMRSLNFTRKRSQN